MARLLFDPEPDATLDKIENNPQLYARVEGPLRKSLRLLQANHKDPRVNRATFSDGLRNIRVPVNGEPDWAILWEEVSPVDAEPAVAIRSMDLDFR